MNIPSSSISTTGHLKFAELMKEGFIQHIWSNTKGLSQRLGVCTTTRWPYKATNQRQVIHLLVSFFVKKSDATEHPHGYEKKRAPLCRCVFFFGNMFSTQFFLTETDLKVPFWKMYFLKKHPTFWNPMFLQTKIQVVIFLCLDVDRKDFTYQPFT